MSLAASPFRSADPLGAFHPATLGVAQGTPPPPRVVPVAALVPSPPPPPPSPPPPPPSPPPATIRAQTSSSSSSSSARTLAARRAAVVRDALDLLEDLERAGRAGSDPRYSPAQARRDAVVRAVLEDLRDEIDDALTVDALMDDDDGFHDATYPGDPFFLEEDYGAEYERERESPRAAAAAEVSRSRDAPQSRYVAQDFVGGAMQSASFLLAAPHAEDPSFVDDWMRCSTLARPCTVAEALRRCTYEPKGSWYRERRSRVNAPLDWPYCEDDLATVYAEGCTEKELFAATCEPRIARSRAAAERARRREAERQRAIERGIRRASENF